MEDQLIRDVAIRDFRRADASISDSLQINSGTISHTSQVEGLVVFFPAEDWRSLTSLELESLMSEKAPLANSVLILDFPASVVAHARTHILPVLAAWRADDEGELARRVMEIRDRLNTELLNQYGIGCKRAGPADCAINRPGQRSTAFNFATSDYMGLHIDTHENQDMLGREKAQLLCCVNLGSAPRFFQFINLSVRRLLQLVGDPFARSVLTARALKDRFLTLFPGYPVIRVTLAPGQAYLCNAQNIIHDGATNCIGAPDIALLMSGDFAFTD